MSKKDKKKSASTAGKALALGTALSLGTFGFTAIGNGPAFGAPTANTATAATNSTKVIKLANGKTRIRVDLADNLRGKTVFIRTSRMVDGKRVVVTLGRVTLNKSGQAVLTVSRKIRVEDRLVVTDGISNIVNSKITVIDDRTPVVPVPTPTPTPAPPAGGGGSAPVADPTIAAVAKIEAFNVANDAATMTIADLTAAGVTGTVAGNLAAYKTAIAGATTGGADTTAKIQAIINTANTTAAVAAIEAFNVANDAATMTIADLTAAGVTGTVAGNLAAYKTAIAGAADGGADTTAKIQAIINTANTTAAEAAAETAVAAYETGTAADKAAADTAVAALTAGANKTAFELRIINREAELAI